MKMPIRTILLFALGATAITAGCTQVQIAPNIRGEYKLGELQVMADESFATVYAAAKSGIQDMKLLQTKDERKVVEADLQARDSTDSLVVVKIKEVGSNRTSVKIRYGISGNLALAQELYQAIAGHY